MRAMALELGWSESAIRTLDRDLGMMGTDAHPRAVTAKRNPPARSLRLQMFLVLALKTRAAGDTAPEEEAPPEQVRVGQCTQCGGSGYVRLPGTEKFTACACLIARRERRKRGNAKP